MARPSGTQVPLDFEPGLIERHPTAVACVREAAYTHRNPLKTIAADMDLSESELSRKLAQNDTDTRRFTLDDLERFIVATGDLTPIYYLIEKYLTDEDQRQKRAIAQLAKDMPKVLALIKQIGIGS